MMLCVGTCERHARTPRKVCLPLVGCLQHRIASTQQCVTCEHLASFQHKHKSIARRERLQSNFWLRLGPPVMRTAVLNQSAVSNRSAQGHAVEVHSGL
jgi:hypothetical protein